MPPPHWEGGGTSKFDGGEGLSQNMGGAYSMNHFMEVCFMFQWGGVVFQMGGFIFKRGCPMGGINFGAGGGFKKIVRW